MNLSLKWIMKKELMLLIRDPYTTVFLLALPIVLITLLGLTASQELTGRKDTSLELVVVDYDSSELSKRFIEHLTADPRIDITVEPREASAWTRLVTERKTALVAIGPEFSERIDDLILLDLLDPGESRLSDGLEAFDVSVRARTIFPLSTDTIAQLLHMKSLEIIVPFVIDKTPLLRAYVQSARKERASSASESTTREPFFADLVPSQNSVFQTLVPAYAVMSAFFLVNLMAHSFVDEKRSGTLLRLQIAPISSTVLILGKALPFFFTAVIQGLLLLAFGWLCFAMDFGSTPLLLIPVVFCVAASAAALALLVSTFFKNHGQVNAFATLLVVGMAGVSGCFIPRDWMPTSIQDLSLVLTPHSWALDAYDQLLTLQEPELPVVWKACAMILVFAGVYFVLALWRYAQTSRDGVTTS